MAYVVDSDPVGLVEGGARTPISLKGWAALIHSDPRLRAPEPVQSSDPFDGQPLTITPHEGAAYVWDNGSTVGMMAWSEEGLDEIVVYGESPTVIALAKEVAQHLGGRFRLIGLNPTASEPAE